MKEFFTTLFWTILLIGAVVYFYQKNISFKYETPTERVTRLNAMADHECPQYKDEMAQACFEHFYQLIEDRD